MRWALVILVVFEANAHAEPIRTSAHERNAELLAWVTTMTGLAMVAIGPDDPERAIGLGAAIVGPSLGIWYSGEVGAIGFGARLAGGLGFAHGVLLRRDEADGWPTFACAEAKAENDRLERRSRLYLYVGGPVFVAATIFDLARTGRAARRWDARHGISVAPMTADATGLAISGRF